MSNFPKLIPAFSCLIVLDAPLVLGTPASSGSLMLAPFTPSSGSLKSESGYPIQLEATMLHGSDYIRTDPSGTHVRLDVNSVWKEKGGGIVKFSYKGVIELTAGSAAVLQGKGTPKTTEFGDALTHVIFETGDKGLSALEQYVYVGSGRFVIEKGKNVAVEYKISQVAA